MVSPQPELYHGIPAIHRRGDTAEWRILIAPVTNLTNPAIRFIAKVSVSDPDGEAKISKASPASITITTPGLPNQIEAAIAISSADTKDLAADTELVWDVQLTANSGAYVKTFPKSGYGKIRIEADVNQTNS